MSRHLVLALLLLLFALASLLFAIGTGSVELSLAEVWRGLTGQDAVATMIVRELRLPRALAGFSVGGLLALSGALLQALLRNPLADPYVLGVSGGAAAATLAALLLGIGGGWMTGSAFAGAILSMLIVFGLSGGAHPMRLLLTGVVLAAAWGALISLMLVLASGAEVRGILFWLMGDLGSARLPVTGLVTLAAGLALAQRLAPALNLLVRGERFAATLGENPTQLRRWLFVLASLLTAVAVTLAGSIGFVGLVVPHVLRLLGSTDHRRLLWQSAVLGGGFLVFADTAARTAIAPAQLPAGIVTALVGVPVFLFLLLRDRRA
jgi:iron complex transport system permease protein